MTAAIETATLFLPIAASSGVFAMRRFNKGVNEFDTNPLYGASNLFISGGQVLKGVRAAKDLTVASGNTSAAESIKSMDTAVKGASESSKFLKYTKSIFTFISKYINPLICVAEGIKVLGSDDKADAAVRSGLGLLGMFTFEKYAKKYMGMPYATIHKNGTRETLRRQALYHKNPFVEKQVGAMKDYCLTKKLFNKVSLSAVPGATKGLLFVLASIGGWKLGKAVANLLLGKEKEDEKSHSKKISMQNPFKQSVAYSSAA